MFLTTAEMCGIIIPHGKGQVGANKPKGYRNTDKFTPKNEAEAFRKWAQWDCVPFGDAEKRAKAEKAGQKEFECIMYCEQTFRELEKRGQPYIRDAVREVYMRDAKHALSAGDIDARVVRFSLMAPASKRQVYRWLASAKDLYRKISNIG